MFSLERDQDVICAVSTPPGYGAIAVVRLSGLQAEHIIRKIAPFLPEKVESHRVYYGHLIDPDCKAEIVDEVLVSFFTEGRSFTGENSFEISCHGSPFIARRILQLLISSGARLAQRGEFTYRAFSNGRIDLTQAESILALIESQSQMAARQALRQLRGSLALQIAHIEEDLTWALSRLEANIDFSSEFIEFATESEIQSRIEGALATIVKLLDTYKSGKTLKEGVKIALCGAPNVGKSSLLNKLSETDRSIVSPLPGTTRDTIEYEIEIDGQRVILVDTAGLREAKDEIEKEGIQRTLKSAKEADAVLFIYDLSGDSNPALPDEIKEAGTPVIRVGNKLDLIKNKNEIKASADCAVSANTGEGLDGLVSQVKEIISFNLDENAVPILHSRQFELLQKINEQVVRSLSSIKDQASPEFIISDLNEALQSCFELTGRRFDDEVLDRVFKDFCLGK